MTDLQEQKFDLMASRVQEIHTAVFGYEGQGGLIRRQDGIDNRIRTIEGWRNKLIGVALAASTVTAYVAPKITDSIVKYLYSDQNKP